MCVTINWLEQQLGNNRTRKIVRIELPLESQKFDPNWTGHARYVKSYLLISHITPAVLGETSPIPNLNELASSITQSSHLCRGRPLGLFPSSAFLADRSSSILV